MKTEVLASIKKTEDEYRSVISEAEVDKKKRISQAELEADNLIVKAQNDAEAYKKQRLADARQQALAKRDEIVKEGSRKAAALNEKGEKNLSRAVDLLVSRFQENLHVQA